VEVCVEQGAVATTVACDADKLSSSLTQVDIGVELDRSTVDEAIVSRRTAVVVPAAAVSRRRRPFYDLVLTVIQLIVVVQRQSSVVNTQERPIGESITIATKQFAPVPYRRISRISERSYSEKS